MTFLVEIIIVSAFYNDTIFAEYYLQYAEKVTPEASFADTLGADSLDTVELIMTFEEEFNIEIPDKDRKKILKVQDAVKYMEEKLGN